MSNQKKEVTLPEEIKAKIISVLSAKIPDFSCPMCRQKNFALADGFFANSVQPNPGSVLIGGTYIPTVSVICTHCGFLSQHALGALNLMDIMDDPPKNEPKSPPSGEVK